MTTPTTTLRGIRPGTLPSAGDFLYLPQTGSVGIVFPRHGDSPLPSATDVIRPRTLIGDSLELHLMRDYSMVLPFENNAYVITPDAVRRLAEHFLENYVLKLPQLKTNHWLRQGIIKFLRGGDSFYARTYFDFNDERLDGYDAELHAHLRKLFDTAAREYLQIPNREAAAAEYAVTYTALFSEEPNREKNPFER